MFLIAESEVQDTLIVTCFPELNPDISIIIGVPTAELPLLQNVASMVTVEERSRLPV